MPRHCPGNGRGLSPGAVSAEALSRSVKAERPSGPGKVGRLGRSRWPPSCLQILGTAEPTEHERGGGQEVSGR